MFLYVCVCCMSHYCHRLSKHGKEKQKTAGSIKGKKSFPKLKLKEENKSSKAVRKSHIQPYGYLMTKFFVSLDNMQPTYFIGKSNYAIKGLQNPKINRNINCGESSSIIDCFSLV